MNADDIRVRVSRAMLELNTIVTKHFGNYPDPKSACMVKAAVNYGCATSQPFGVSTIANITGLSRRKVYDTLALLQDNGLVRKVDHAPLPYYVRTGGGQCDAGCQAESASLFLEVERALRVVCEEGGAA